MIIDKKNLKEYLDSDNQWLHPKNIKERMIQWITYEPARVLRRYLYFLRKQEYYINTAGNNKVKQYLALYYEGKKNRLGIRLGIEIGPNVFGKGLNLYHGGSIIINPNVRVGTGCSLHGANCIGNNGLSKAVPIIGDNVDIGYGAVIIGDITIADNVKIGANAVVNKSITESGCTVAGIPAIVVKRSRE